MDVWYVRVFDFSFINVNCLSAWRGISEEMFCVTDGESWSMLRMLSSRFEITPSHLFRVLASCCFSQDEMVGDSSGGEIILELISLIASLGTFLFKAISCET